jgi:predicted nucleic acid-binding Zn ribbon protein
MAFAITLMFKGKKILKIADRHGWDTVNEYLDDPLADNNEDASKLRGAIVRVGRIRKRPGFRVLDASKSMSPA